MFTSFKVQLLIFLICQIKLRSLQSIDFLLRPYVGKEWAVVGGLNQLESTTKLPVVLTRGASTKMAISTIVDFNLFQLEKCLNQLRLIPG